MPNVLFASFLPPQLVPEAVYVGLLVACPILQWALLTTSLDSFLATLIPLTIGLATPLLLTVHSWFVFGFGCALQLINTFRLLDLAFVDRQMSKTWTFRLYLEYFCSLDNAQTRLARRALEKHPKPDPNVYPHQRTTRYYAAVALRWFYQWVIYHGTVWYLETYKVDDNPSIRALTPLAFKPFVDQGVLLLSFYLLLNMTYIPIYHTIAILLQTPYRPIMQSPFTTGTVREFWSGRWNLVVKESIHRAAFEPTMAFLTHRFQKAHPRAKHGPLYYPALGALSSFILSGLIHEWLILTLCNTPSHGEHMLFFLLQALFTICETIVEQVCKKQFKFNPYKEFYWIMTPFSILLLGLAGNLFMAPLMRENIFVKIRFPNLITLLL